MSFRVLVCGGRDYTNVEKVFHVLQVIDQKKTITAIGHGAARGADSIADYWGKATNKLVLAFPADWDSHGNFAGSIRNRHMLREFKPDLVVAFPGGNGTRDMINVAEDNGVPVFKVSE